MSEETSWPGRPAIDDPIPDGMEPDWHNREAQLEALTTIGRKGGCVYRDLESAGFDSHTIDRLLMRTGPLRISGSWEPYPLVCVTHDGVRKHYALSLTGDVEYERIMREEPTR